MHFVSVAAAALLIVPSLQQDLPKAYIYNGCNFDVNVWSVTAGDPGTKVNIPANGGTYNETYKQPSVGGVSLKLTPEDSCDNSVPITQFEYTYTDSQIWYDLSDVNCGENDNTKACPFRNSGMFMHSRKGCPLVSCPQGIKCANAYNAFNDDWATKSCDPTADVHLYLCQTTLPENANIKALDEITDDIEAIVPIVKRHVHHARHPHWRSS